jgi:CubicO group peptidase (beta-lactamase class C family)
MLLVFTVSVRGQLEQGRPSDVDMSEAQLQRASALVQAEVESGRMGAAALLVARRGRVVLHRAFGRISPAPGAPATQPDSVFLVASVTKPVTASALMLLVERGRILLSDSVDHYFPEFSGSDRNKIMVRDLLRHTSGLPDMLPENIDLRRTHSPLSEFVRHTLSTPLLFPPGTRFSYQSMGVLLAGEIVEKLSGERLRDFEKREIFDPLGMKGSSLGLGGRRLSDVVTIHPPVPGTTPADDADFGLNSLYWRDLGAPWGGMHSTTTDLAIFLQTFLNGGVYAGKRVFSPATVKAMTLDQNAELNAPWGLGWALGNSKGSPVGDLVSAKTFGHAGATGTLVWADPETQLLCVILTNRPYVIDDGRFLRLVSNAVAAAVQQSSRGSRQLPAK